MDSYSPSAEHDLKKPEAFRAINTRETFIHLWNTEPDFRDGVFAFVAFAFGRRFDAEYSGAYVGDWGRTPWTCAPRYIRSLTCEVMCPILIAWSSVRC